MNRVNSQSQTAAMRPSEGSETGRSVSHRVSKKKLKKSRPAPLSTISAFDDDVSFNKIALGMHLQYEKLSSSVSDVIHSTLSSPSTRASFYHGLCNRLSWSFSSRPPLSPSSESIVKKTNEIFGDEMRRIVAQEYSSTIQHQLETPSPYLDHQSEGVDLPLTPCIPRHNASWSPGSFCTSPSASQSCCSHVSSDENSGGNVTKPRNHYFFCDSSDSHHLSPSPKVRKTMSMQELATNATTQLVECLSLGEEKGAATFG